MDEQLREVFAENLRYFMDQSDKTQADLMRYMKVSSATASDWVNGRKMPRADKLQALASWLGTELSALLTKRDEQSSHYYLDPETAEMAQQLFNNRDMRILFDAARDSKPEDLAMAADLLKRLKETNPNG